MDIFEQLKTVGPRTILKYALIGFVGVLILSFVLSLLNTARNSISTSNTGYGVSNAPSYGGAEMDMTYNGGSKLSTRNVASMPIMPPQPGYTSGNDAESFEVKDYSATFETRDADKECSTILSLKSREDVIFESSNEYDRGCNYTFKVKQGSVPEILTFIKNLDPKNLSENSYTIKRLVEDYTSETDILEKKLQSIDATLNQAIAAYDNITVLATQTKDVESLAKIIDSKINIIERLTVERMNVNAQIEGINRAKAQELDRLLYTTFNISVYENAFVNGDQIKDSWKASVQQSLIDMNRVLQQISIGLVSLLLQILQYLLYAVILLVVAKFSWKFAQRVWNA